MDSPGIFACLAVVTAANTNVQHPWHAIGSDTTPYRNGAYIGPFLPLTLSYLSVMNLTDGYGPECVLYTEVPRNPNRD